MTLGGRVGIDDNRVGGAGISLTFRMTAMSHKKVGLLLIFVIALLATLASSCASDHDFNKQIRTITKPYRFDLVAWEFKTLAGEAGELFTREDETTDNATGEVIRYFDNVARMKNLEANINAVRAGNQGGDPAAPQTELDRLRQENAELTDTVVRALESQVRETLSQQGIFNPIYRHIKLEFGFPPVNIYLGRLPKMLVVSPRDRIESIKKVTLLPEISQEEMEEIEAAVDRLGVSSLVVNLGGMATYPTYVDNEANPRFTFDTIVHEWLHQYLAFTPLGFRYILDQTGVHADYEIATINETVADIVGKEIGGIIYEKYYPGETTVNVPAEANETEFDFNKEMREIRKAVDDYLARGEIEAAEAFMEQKRQYLAENGYYIRKLNQAYFAFHGTYADSPTSISPIGGELKTLREQSTSLKDFLDSVASIKSREDLTDLIK
jgi:hypothetical protein